MLIQILSKLKKVPKFGKRLSKKVIEDVNCFFYDEDCFWFDYEGKRFGLPYFEIVKLRKKTLRDLNKEIKKLEEDETKHRLR